MEQAVAFAFASTMVLSAGRVSAGQADDPAAVVRLLHDQDVAILRVGERLAVAGAAICGNSGWSAGMAVQQLSQYGAPYRTVARTMLGIGYRPTVAAVASGGAAERAGLRSGDRIAEIDGRLFSDNAPTRANGGFDDAARTQDAIDAAFMNGSARLLVIRDGTPISLTLAPRPACRARFEVAAGRSAKASSDGVTVKVSSGLVAQAQGDGELGAILAHELAHNILEHPQRLEAGKGRPSVRTTEIQADRLSVYLLDVAGYGVAGALRFWSRWGRANDLGILSDRTHPGWKKRMATIQAETDAIAATRSAGRPVVPPDDLRRLR